MRNQRGAILVVALILLVLLGIMGTTSLRSVVFQERLTSQMHDRNKAFEAAEAGLAWCEQFYDALPYAYSGPNEMVDAIRIGDEIADTNDPDSVVMASRAASHAWYLDDSFWASDAREAALGFVDNDDLLSGLAQNPHCVRERVVSEVSSGYFSAAYAGKDDVMADKNGGSAIRSGGVYHFRTTAQGVGRGSTSGDRALTKVVLQADYFRRLD